MKSLVIYGAGGLGREMAVHCRGAGRVVKGFLDDGISAGQIVDGLTVLGGRDWLKENSAEVILAFGDPVVKRNVFDAVKNISGADWSVPLIDRNAKILDKEKTSLGVGSVITAGVVMTTNIRVGKFVLINLNTSIGHDTVIGDFTSIMPGCNIAGAVTIGEGVLIGSGVNILGGVVIGAGAVIGSGAVVNRNVRPGVTAVGVPAREIEK